MMTWGVLLLALLGSAEAAKDTEASIPAVILKVEGDGLASVRKHSGIVETAGVRGKVYPGDRVITDARTAVTLLLNDGSVVRAGFNTDLAVESVENRGRFLQWLFKLAHGGLRALVEKAAGSEAHLRVETPNATLGVRGTELVLAYDAAAGSSLFLVDGEASFGAPACEKTKSCAEVKTGESSALAKAAAAPSKPQKFDMKALFSDPPSEERMSLFRDAKKVAQSKLLHETFTEPALAKLVQDSGAELAEAQDRAIGRTRAEREAAHAAIKAGTYEKILVAADAFAEARGLFRAQSNGGAENLVAQTAAAKFRLGLAVMGAEQAGVFMDKETHKGEPWAGRVFRERKIVDYDQSADVKAKRAALKEATDDYHDTLEFAEAADATQVGDGKEGETEIAPLKASESDCKDIRCINRRVEHEIDVASEGTVNAFHGKKPEALSKAVASKRGKGALPGSVATRFFSRTVPGNSCATTKQTCKLVPCLSLGRAAAKNAKCQAGQFVQVCEQRQVPVRCPEK